MDVILNSVKKLLGLMDDYKHFDTDIIIHINSVFSVLNQIGIGPVEGFMIHDDSALWTEYIQDNPSKLQLVKSYMFLKVRLLFDPPQSSFLLEANNRTIEELEWRLQAASESNK